MSDTADTEIQNQFLPEQYYSRNLSVFPVRVLGGILSPPEKWQNWCNYLPPSGSRSAWSDSAWNDLDTYSVGLATGKVFDVQHRIVCLDIDHPALVNCLSYLFPSPCARFGSKGLGLFYRVDKDEPDLKKSQNFIIPARGTPAVEYLSLGRFTFIPPSLHRKTGKSYEWRGRPLVDVIDQLPVLTPKDLRVIKAIVTLNSEGANVENLVHGESTHHPTLALVASLVGLGLSAEKVENAVALLFPKDYKGDSLREIPEMVASAFKKGFDKKQERPSDGDLDDEELSDIFADWHYVVSTNRMVNSVTKASLDRERFEALMANRVRRAWSIYSQWPQRSVKLKMTYLPAQPAVLEDAINMWRPTELNPKAGNVSPWLSHILNFYSHDEVDHMLNWLAYVVQNPSQKAGHAVLMGSKFEGIGKDLWLVPIRMAFGKHNVSEIGADSLGSQFNEWLAHKHLIIIQEIWTGARRELSNQLKPLLSSPPDEIMVNEKGIARYPIPNICASIMLTNHKDAVSMAAEDRRYFVMWSEEKPQAPEYYSTFAEWVSDVENQSHVYHYLLHRDVSKFNIKAPPPKTTAKMDMVDATMTKAESLVAVIRDILREAPLKDIVSETGIYAVLMDISNDVAREVVKIPRTSPRYPIRLALKELGYEKLDQNAVKKIGGKVHQLPVYCIPESKDKYVAMRPVEIYDIVNSALDF
jgi:Family of unknown function (DUF5906)